MATDTTRIARTPAAGHCQRGLVCRRMRIRARAKAVIWVAWPLGKDKSAGRSSRLGKSAGRSRASMTLATAVNKVALVIISAIMFASGENLIAAFLPEIVPARKMGRMSGYGWGLGYLGGLLTLGLCLACSSSR